MCFVGGESNILKLHIVVRMSNLVIRARQIEDVPNVQNLGVWPGLVICVGCLFVYLFVYVAVAVALYCSIMCRLVNVPHIKFEYVLCP